LQKAARAPAARWEAQRLQGQETALAEAEALRLDDLKNISFKENRKGSCTYLMDGCRTTWRDASGTPRKIDAAKASRKARAMKATAPVIKL